MTKSTLKNATAGLALALSLVAPSGEARTAAAAEPGATSTSTISGPGAALGVGAAQFLNGPTGVDVMYDLSRFHIEGILAFDNNDSGPGDASTTIIFFGARGWYHVHTGTNADFSLGGGLAMASNNGGAGPSSSAVLLEPGAQARLFLTPNFAFNGTVGFSLALGDNYPGTSNISLKGQALGSLGFNYFFR